MQRGRHFTCKPGADKCVSLTVKSPTLLDQPKRNRGGQKDTFWLISLVHTESENRIELRYDLAEK